MLEPSSFDIHSQHHSATNSHCRSQRVSGTVCSTKEKEKEENAEGEETATKSRRDKIEIRSRRFDAFRLPGVSSRLSGEVKINFSC